MRAFGGLSGEKDVLLCGHTPYETALPPTYPQQGYNKDKNDMMWSNSTKEDRKMQPIPLLRRVGLSAFLGLVSLALPLPAHAGVHVSVGIGLPVPVLVAPAPVVVAPPPVIYPAPVVVGTGYYGYAGYRPGYWRHHHRYGYYGYRHGHWRHHPHHRWHRR